jgi:hypothetical protein
LRRRITGLNLDDADAFEAGVELAFVEHVGDAEKERGLSAAGRVLA